MHHNPNFTGSGKPVLVIGGHGKTGRRVVARLTEAGVPVRIGSRAANPAFDWNNAATWGRALEGVAGAYITYQPDLAVPGALEAVDTFARLAVQMGVRRLVLLSGRGEPEAQAAERALIGLGVDWTIVRASWFAQNFSESFLLDSVRAGEVALPVADVAEPFVDAEDIAEVVARAFLENGHVGRLYEVTGPRLMTFAEAIGEIAAASGREIRFVPVTPRDYESALRSMHVPQELAALLMMLFTEVLDGRNQYLADGVQRALGRPPRDFAHYARTTAQSGVWSPAEEDAARQRVDA